MRKPVFLLGLILITALLWPTRANTEELKKYIPLQDTNGSVLALADENGNLIERVSYTPYGKPTFIYDHVPPNIDQVRIVGDALRIRFSEPVDQTKALEAITLTQGTTALTGNASFSEDDRLLSIKSSNGFPQQALTLEIATTLEDKYENHLVNSFTQDFTPTGVDQLIYDCCPPNIKSVLLVDGAIRVEFDEEIDPASIANSLELTDRDLHTPVAGVISLYDEKTATLTPSSPLTLFDSNSQTPTSYVLRIKTTFTDLSNKPLDGEMLQYFAYHGNNRIIYKAPAEDEHTRSSVGNTITFQGHEYDPDTGLIHFRNRDYSPELGRFLQPDPMGYADSSNLYQAFGNNPVNMTDPMGMALASGQNVEHVLKAYKELRAAGNSHAVSYKKLVQWGCIVDSGRGLKTDRDYEFGLQSAWNLSPFDVTPKQFGKDVAGGTANAMTGAAFLGVQTLPGVAGNPFVSPYLNRAYQSISNSINRTIGAQSGSLGYTMGQVYAPVVAGGFAAGALGETSSVVEDYLGNVRSSVPGMGLWGEKPTTRGVLIENQLAKTEYKDWFHVGAEDNGYFPLVDFQQDNNLVSLKTVDTAGNGWMRDMELHIQDLSTRSATVNGQRANMILDLRVPPGGRAAAEPLIQYGEKWHVTVRIGEIR